jgi:GIY-YIG catalytic domain
MEGSIYKLYVEGLDEFCYVGSTQRSLAQRFEDHKNAALYDSQTKARSHILFTDGNEPVIELLEGGTYANKEEMEARERYWIGRFPECLNNNIPGRKWQERHALNKDRNIALHKKWIEENKDQQAAYKAAKRLANLEEARQKDKEQRERRKEQIAAAKKVKVECPTCKKVMAKNSLWTHIKTIHSE